MRPVIGVGVAAILLAIASLATPLGAQTDHDLPTTARNLVGAATASGATVAADRATTVDATADDEPFPPVFSGGAVWWTWQAPSSVGTLTVSTDGSTFDTVLSVWRGQTDELELVAWSDDVDFLGGALHSEVTVAVEAGETYRIAVAGYLYSHAGEAEARAGDVELTATWSPIELVTSSADGGATADVSADGRFIAFATTQPLLPEDENELADVYRLDPVEGEVVLVSSGREGIGTGATGSPAISADGTAVAFVSMAADPGVDDNGDLDVFVHDLEAGVLRLASRTPGGRAGNGGSFSPSLSADGTRVAFASVASDLVPGDTNGVSSDVFVHDLSTGATTLVSADLDGGSAETDSLDPVISADGAWVAFESAATDLTTDDLDAETDVFVRRIDGSTPTLRVPGGGGDAAGWITADPALSGDGRVVVVTSRPADGEPAQILHHVLGDGGDEAMTTIISERGARPTVSADGRIVAYASDTGDGPGAVSVVDVVLGQAVDVDAELPATVSAVLSDDGSRLVVTAPGDDEHTGRILLVDRGVPERVTGLVATPGDGRLDLAWDEIAADEYEVLVDPPVGAIQVDGTSAAITGLTNGVTHRVEVRGLSAPGAGPAAIAEAIPSTTPSAIRIDELRTDDGLISIDWTLPDDGGLPLLEYSITVEPDEGELIRDDSAVVVEGLVPGASYTVTIAAENGNGRGPEQRVGPIVAAPGATGYLLIDADGRIASFGEAPDLDDLGITTSGQVVSISALPGTIGTLILTSDGVIWSRGATAPGLTTPGTALDLAPGEQVVDLLTGVDVRRAWVVTSTGRVITRGAATSFGDLAGEELAAPIVAADLAPDGQGYVMVGADGGVFAFGSAGLVGRPSADEVAAGVVEIVADPDGTGYWVVTADGGVFSYEAVFAGSAAGQELNAPVVGAAAFADGYLLVAADGGVFNFSSAPFLGSVDSSSLVDPIVAVTPTIG